MSIKTKFIMAMLSCYLASLFVFIYGISIVLAGAENFNHTGIDAWKWEIVAFIFFSFYAAAWLADLIADWDMARLKRGLFLMAITVTALIFVCIAFMAPVGTAKNFPGLVEIVLGSVISVMAFVMCMAATGEKSKIPLLGTFCKLACNTKQ